MTKEEYLLRYEDQIVEIVKEHHALIRVII